MKRIAYVYNTNTKMFVRTKTMFVPDDIDPESVLGDGETYISPDLTKEHVCHFFDERTNTWIERESMLGRRIIDVRTKNVERCEQHECPDGYTADVPDLSKLDYLYWDGCKFVCDRSRLTTALYAKAMSVMRAKCKQSVQFDQDSRLYLGKTNISTLMMCQMFQCDVTLLDNKCKKITVTPEKASSVLKMYLNRKSNLATYYSTFVENLDSLSDEELFAKLEELEQEDLLLTTGV